MAHQEFGYRLIERIRNELEPHSVVEQFPKMEGRQMVMVLAPKKAVVPVVAKKKAVPKEGAKPAAAVAKPEGDTTPVAAEAEKK